VAFNFRRSNGACELFDSSTLKFEKNAHCISWYRIIITPLQTYPHDCSDLLKRYSNSTSGRYFVRLINEDKVIQVYCDMQTDGGGWTVIQRRIDGSEAFTRTWNEFADGFGNLCTEFWLGNDNLASLTNAKSYQLRIDLGDFNGQYRYATYNNLRIGTAAEKYMLMFTQHSYSGDAGDSLSYHLGMRFSTYDNDNDLHSTVNCASMFHGAWWYNSCLDCNLHGIYNSTQNGGGVNWYSWLAGKYSLRFAEMKIRPQPF
jgi:ficolin